MAGAVGFEPTNAGSKGRYLTERRMKNVGIAWVYFFRILKTGSASVAKNYSKKRPVEKNFIKVKIVLERKEA